MASKEQKIRTFGHDERVPDVIVITHGHAGIFINMNTHSLSLSVCLSVSHRSEPNSTLAYVYMREKNASLEINHVRQSCSSVGH